MPAQGLAIVKETSRESTTVSAAAARRVSLAFLQHLDWTLLVLVLAVTSIGLLVLRGAVDGIPALKPTITKQTLFLVPALAAMAAAFLVDYRWINRAAMALYGFNIVALILVLFAGKTVNGSRSWIDLGVVNWQPSETMKIATVLVCAQWLALKPEQMQGWRGLVFPAVICGVPTLLVLMQPDLGTASLFFVIFLTMMVVAGARARHLGLVLGAALAGMASAWPFLKPYQKARIWTFINPEADPGGAGYNVIQSMVAVGNGGLRGQGLGEGTQGTLRFLPEHHTDFIFASAVEQLGLLGAASILLLFGAILWRMLCVMDIARDRFGGLVVAGLFAIIFGHVAQNIGMSMGLLPVTGIPLPLMSYGGTFLVTTFLLFGLVLNVSSRRFTFA